MEVKTEVKVYTIDYLCESCKIPMVKTGKAHLCAPPLFEYCCKVCDNIVNLSSSYPKTVYEKQHY